MSTFVPRKCGLAVFTKDLVDSLDLINDFDRVSVAAVRKRGAKDGYEKRVRWLITQDEESEYVQIAEQLNNSNLDLVNLQHEFGIFGGRCGGYILSFLENIKLPVVTTLHTVQPDFEPEALNVLRQIITHSQAVVVTGNIATRIIANYGFPSEKIKVIQHGCPDVPFLSSESVKESLGLKGKRVLCTFGLISKGKGIEYAIQALPSIIERHPKVLYLVIGETHPEVKMAEDENYRRTLIELVEELGLQNHVEFQNRFLSKTELIKYLQATDVYITPYLGKNQISSGTLIYASGTGRAVVSTPYFHAKEVLADGRGLFCDFKDPNSLADAVNSLLDNDKLRRSMERKAYNYSRSFTWPEVARKYSQVFKQAIKNDDEVMPIELAPHNS